MTKPEIKGRILFLHGHTQSADIFYAKLSALRKRLQKLQYQSVYLNAPFRLTPSQLPSADLLALNSVADEDTNNRTWWYKKNSQKDAVDVTPALDAIRDYVKNGTIVDADPDDSAAPIVGIVGFSQGAALGGLVVHTFEELFGVTTLKFAVLYSGFKLNIKDAPEPHLEKYYTSNRGAGDAKILHVIGELDTVVGDDRNLSLYDHSPENSDVLKHPGGHFVPNSKLMIDQVTNWIQAVEKGQEREDEKEDDIDDLLDMMDSFGGA